MRIAALWPATVVAGRAGRAVASAGTWPTKSHSQTKRVTLTLGEATEVAVVCRIFREFVDLGYSTAHIADGLNAHWTARQVLACLRAKSYAAAIIYRRKKKTSQGKADQWVRTTKGGEGVVSVEQFQRAQEKLKRAR